MGILIDSSVLIAAERGRLNLDMQLSKFAQDPVVIAAITASELLHGVHRATAEHQVKHQAFVDGILRRLTLIAFDLTMARAHAQIWAQLAAKGVAIGAHDLLIGATAVALDYQIATCDKRSFAQIPGLKVLYW